MIHLTLVMRKLAVRKIVVRKILSESQQAIVRKMAGFVRI